MKINRVFLRGDTHGNYDWLPEWCEANHTTTNDVLIILGDSALRFEGPKPREIARKTHVAAQPITIFAVRGNHDRPFCNGLQYDCELVACPLLDVNSHLMWHDKEYPNLWYFDDYGVYYIKNRSFLVVGGAYSVDVEWRKIMHWTWYEEEQLTPEQWLDLFDLVHDRGFDYVLTHTCPYSWRPTDLFMSGIDQSKVDTTTEERLEELKNIITFSYWDWAHYHSDRDYGDGRKMYFEDIDKIL